MKTKLVTLLLLFFCLSAMADDPRTHLVIWAKDGSKIVYPLGVKPQVLLTETELVLRICKTGRSIAEECAAEYYDAITVGIDFTARDLQRECKAKGHPWEKAKAFDGSAPIGEFKSISALQHPEDIAFGMKLNGEWVQQGRSRDMIFGFNRLVAHVSRFITLEEGDCIFTGTPQGVGEVHANDTLELFLEGEPIFSFKVK